MIDVERVPTHASKVIVPIGLRPEAERVASVAAQLAAVVDAPTEFVHVVSSLDAPPPSERRRTWMPELAATHHASLRLVEHLSASSGIRDVVADDPDAIICMGVDAAGGALDVVLGSVAEDLLRFGHHRCLLVGPRVAPGRDITGPTVVCVDGSGHAESILPTAAAWAATVDAPTWVVSVTSGEPLPADLDESVYVSRIAHQLGVEDAEWEVLHGDDHARSIIDFADHVGAGSIVMATHGRTGFSRAALGSVTMRVVHGSPCPVLARRPPFLSKIVTD